VIIEHHNGSIALQQRFVRANGATYAGRQSLTTISRLPNTEVLYVARVDMVGLKNESATNFASSQRNAPVPPSLRCIHHVACPKAVHHAVDWWRIEHAFFA